MWSSKYYFDIKTGHYKLKTLNEADATGQTNNGQQTSNSNSVSNIETKTSEEQTTPSQDTTSQFQSYESDSQIQTLMSQINEIKRILSNDLNTLNKQKEAIINSIDASTDNSVYDPYQGKTIKIDEQIEDKTWIANQKIHNLQKQIHARIEALAKQTKTQQVAESFKKFNIPSKYTNLNESNIGNAKIYIDKLIDKDDEECPIRNMNDFKRLFKNSSLIIGKEPTSSSKVQKFFVICVDANDVDIMQSILTDAGYDKDDIIDVIMPQVLDRSKYVI